MRMYGRASHPPYGPSELQTTQKTPHLFEVVSPPRHFPALGARTEMDAHMRRFSSHQRRRFLGLAAAAALLFSACAGDAVIQADRAAPTAIPAPASVNEEGQDLSLGVVDGGDATGMLITDHRGFAVYGVTNETTDALVCDEDCTRVWIPVRPRGDAIPQELDPALYGVFERPEGGDQVSYRDIPLYTWTGDSEIGRTAGAGVAGSWFALTEVGGFLGE